GQAGSADCLRCLSEMFARAPRPSRSLKLGERLSRPVERKNGISEFCYGGTFLAHRLGDRTRGAALIFSISRARWSALFQICRFVPRSILTSRSRSMFGPAIAWAVLVDNFRHTNPMRRVE